MKKILSFSIAQTYNNVHSSEYYGRAAGIQPSVS